jgi:hypothetical protein
MSSIFSHLRIHPAIWVSIGFLPFSLVAFADGDWPQWRGPNRDGHAALQSLLKNWPVDGPKLAWTFSNAGTGFSSVSVAGNDLLTMGKRSGQNLLICLDTKTGSEKWVASLGPSAQGKEYNTNWGDGPRSSPTIDGDYVYALCDLGSLGCFKRSDGTQVWSVNLVADFGGSVPTWGYSESVLVDGDRVVVAPGGKSFLVGLDKNTGKKVWESRFSDEAHYVSIVRHIFEGVPVYVTASARGLLGIHCQSGELLFENSATGNATAVIPTPIVSGNLIYHSSAYGAGNAAVEITLNDGKLNAKQKYHEKKESMENHHGGTVLHDGTIFGFSKALRGVWMAQDLATGKVLWSKKIGRATSGSVAFADGLLYCYDDQDGICYLVQPARDGWIEKGKVAIPDKSEIDRQRGAIWSHPVIADQKLIVRDLDKIFAFDIQVEK